MPGPGRVIGQIALAYWLIAAGVPTQAAEAVGGVFTGLDKITARTSRVEAPFGSPTRFGAFEIIVSYCRTTPPEEPPESKAFVTIVEHQVDGTIVEVFAGWMFASSPGLNAVEHPVYDVWLISCMTSSAEASEDRE